MLAPSTKMSNGPCSFKKVWNSWKLRRRSDPLSFDPISQNTEPAQRSSIKCSTFRAMSCLSTNVKSCFVNDVPQMLQTPDWRMWHSRRCQRGQLHVNKQKRTHSEQKRSSVFTDSSSCNTSTLFIISSIIRKNPSGSRALMNVFNR